MSEQTYPTGMIRQELASLMPTKRICHQTWQHWRSVAAITGHRATHRQWIEICACFALHHRGEPVTRARVLLFLRRHGDDPQSFLPGFVSVGARPLPVECFGADLRDLFLDLFGVCRTEKRISDWCKAAGLPWSRGYRYQQAEIYLIAREMVRAQMSRRLVAQQNLRRIA